LSQSLVRADPADTAGFDASTHAVEGPASSRFLFGARVPQYDQFSHKRNALHVSLDM
jgi:hypothetical protein